MALKWVTLDCETSGLDSLTDRVIELAAVWRYEGKLLYVHELINPGIHIPPEISGITHLTDEDVAEARTLDKVLNEKSFPTGICVAHNAKFDKGFLHQLNERRWICTMRTCQHIFPDLPNYKNQTIRYALGLKPELPEGLAPHRALYDALVTNAIFEKILETHTIEEILDLQDKPILLKTVRFGKHKGLAWKDVDKSYLQWMLKQDDSGGIDDDIRYTARHYLHNS